ncbi:hypothetical protein LCGC14_2425350 [marine sediment metagenome]|uniref:Uncharacterized protein n=1 Tax=marine sediment metagenome TaxID=412755 RepID=A0A0F9CAP3_9ZZZZ
MTNKHAPETIPDCWRCRLNAAAPNLLEALEVLTAWVEKADRCDVPWPNLLREAGDKARAAIKAAKGNA